MVQKNLTAVQDCKKNAQKSTRRCALEYSLDCKDCGDSGYCGGCGECKDCGDFGDFGDCWDGWDCTV